MSLSSGAGRKADGSANAASDPFPVPKAYYESSFPEPLVDFLGSPPDGDGDVWTQALVDELTLNASDPEEGALGQFFLAAAVRHVRDHLDTHSDKPSCLAWARNFGLRRPCSRPPAKEGEVAGLLCSSHTERGLFMVKVAFVDYEVRAEYGFDNEMRLDFVGSSSPPEMDIHIVAALAYLARTWPRTAPSQERQEVPGAPTVSLPRARAKGKEPMLSRSRSRSIPPSPGVDAILINKLADGLQQVLQRLDALERRGVTQRDPALPKVPGPAGLPPPPVPPVPGPSGLPPSGSRLRKEPTGALDDPQLHFPPGWDEVSSTTTGDDYHDKLPQLIKDTSWRIDSPSDGLYDPDAWNKPELWLPYFSRLWDDPAEFDLRWTVWVSRVLDPLCSNLLTFHVPHVKADILEIRTLLTSEPQLQTPHVAMIKNKIVTWNFYLLCKTTGTAKAKNWYRALMGSSTTPKEWLVAERVARHGAGDDVITEAAKRIVRKDDRQTEPAPHPNDVLAQSDSLPSPSALITHGDLAGSPGLTTPSTDVSPSPSLLFACSVTKWCAPLYR